jgi:hypothetical protein
MLGTETHYGLDDSEFEPRWEQEIFSSSCLSKSTPRPTASPVAGTVVLFRE